MPFSDLASLFCGGYHHGGQLGSDEEQFRRGGNSWKELSSVNTRNCRRVWWLLHCGQEKACDLFYLLVRVLAEWNYTPQSIPWVGCKQDRCYRTSIYTASGRIGSAPGLVLLQHVWCHCLTDNLWCNVAARINVLNSRQEATSVQFLCCLRCNKDGSIKNNYPCLQYTFHLFFKCCTCKRTITIQVSSCIAKFANHNMLLIFCRPASKDKLRPSDLRSTATHCKSECETKCWYECSLLEICRH